MRILFMARKRGHERRLTYPIASVVSGISIVRLQRINSRNGNKSTPSCRGVKSSWFARFGLDPKMERPAKLLGRSCSSCEWAEIDN
jgi:hypothetical protein